MRTIRRAGGTATRLLPRQLRTVQSIQIQTDKAMNEPYYPTTYACPFCVDENPTIPFDRIGLALHLRDCDQMAVALEEYVKERQKYHVRQEHAQARVAQEKEGV